jgi:hypothetical protein
MEEQQDIFLVIMGVAFLLGILAVYIFFLVAQQNTLKAIQFENRFMRPGEVWLQLIPLFGLVWQFIVVNRISDSIRREFQSWQNDSILGISEGEAITILNSRPTYDIGIAYCILSCCGCVPLLGYVTAIASLICMIIYWTRLIEFKRKIESRQL